MRKWLTIAAVLLVSGTFYGCLKDSIDNKTVVLFGEEAYVKSFEEVFGMRLDDSIGYSAYNHVLYLDSVIPGINGLVRATQTPDVRGEYRFAPRSLTFSTYAYLPNPNDTVYFRLGGDFQTYHDYLHGQHHLITHCDIDIPGLGVNALRFRTDTAYVTGYGPDFLVYFERRNELVVEPNSHVSYRLTQGIAIRGTLDVSHQVYLVDSLPNGTVDTIKICYPVQNATMAIFNKEVKDIDPPSYADQIGNLRGMLSVYRDLDSNTEVNNDKKHPWVDWDHE